MRRVPFAVLLALGAWLAPARADCVVHLRNGHAIVCSLTSVVGTRTVMRGEGWSIAVPNEMIASTGTTR